MTKTKGSHLQGFLDSVRRRQKNIVFPDTVQNEADGFRRLYEGKRPLTLTEFIGMTALIVALVVFTGGIIALFWLYLVYGEGVAAERLVRVIVAFSFVLIPLGVFFYFMRRSLRRERGN